MPVIERWHTYQLTMGDMAAGVTKSQIPLILDSDAPFILRGIAGYRYGTVQTLAGGLLNYTDADNRFLQTDPIGFDEAINTTLYDDVQGSGQFSQFSPVFPQYVYPAGSSIWVTFQNNTVATDWTDVKILFRGVKLYDQGVVWSPTYPQCPFYLRPFFLPYPNPSGPTFTLTAQQTLWTQTLVTEADADVVVRAIDIAISPTTPVTSWNTYIRVYDKNRMYYDNDFINVDWQFSRNQPQRPGIIYPEIYLPAKQALYFDISRNDPGGDPVTFQMSLQGAKVVV